MRVEVPAQLVTRIAAHDGNHARQADTTGQQAFVVLHSQRTDADLEFGLPDPDPNADDGVHPQRTGGR